MNTENLREKNILHLEDVNQHYGGPLILENIDLSVAAGELCTVVGPSGHGKSTLLRIILGQELPVSGSVFIDGEPVGFANTDRGIVYQRYSLMPNMTALENVMLSANLRHGFFERRRRRKEFEENAMFFLEKVRLGEHAHKYPHELSGGMQQRVAVVQALIAKPKILLMDEPFGALDPGTREELQVFLMELSEETGMTIFFVTHDLEEACYLATRIIVISKFYTDDRGEDVERGSRIAFGEKLRDIGTVQSVDAKYTEKFGRLIERVRIHGFDPEYLQHVNKFNLAHPDSFQTLTEDESGGS